jgi:leucyl-tRNA synthetase
MSEKYALNQVEKKWQKYWYENNVFAADDASAKPPFYVLEMFPYPSGTLHMGHARNYAIGDALARFRWAKGYEVLHPMGWDACGLPAENAALKHDIHPKTWTYDNAAAMKKQFFSLGFSHDWSREFFSCDPSYYRHEQKMFLDFLAHNLAYRKESYVNWDPQERSVLANEQVVDGRGWRSGAVVEKRLLKQWFLKITDFAEELLHDLDDLTQWPEAVRDMQRHWIGKSKGLNLTFQRVPNGEVLGAEDVSTNRDVAGKNKEPADPDSKTLEIFTTRPETLYGATFCAIAWDHPWVHQALPEYQGDLGVFIKECQQKGTSSRIMETEAQRGVRTGIFVRHPFLHEVTLPVVVANYVSSDYGTGAIFGCPAHDERDYGLAKILGLPIVHVIRPEDPSEDPSIVTAGAGDGETVDATGITEAEPAETETVTAGARTETTAAGTFTSAERETVAARARTQASPGDAATQTPYTGDGIMVASDFLNGLTVIQARATMIDHCVQAGLGQAKTLYRLRDWGVGRQRYWGVPIPIIYCPSCGTIPVPEKDLPVVLPEDVRFDQPGNPLQNHPTWKNVPCPSCGIEAQRETDTFDTFFESSWYFARFCDPHNTQKAFSPELAQRWLPVHQYVGGIEHAVMHLLYARFFTKALKKCGYWNIGEPFQGMFTQGMVCHKTFQGADGSWLSPEEVDFEGKRCCDGSAVVVGRSEKMSKSKCNVVGVTQMVDTYGADAVRLFVLSDTPPQKDLEWTEEGIEGAWRYVRRVWSLFQGNLEYCLMAPWPSEMPKTFSENGTQLRRVSHKFLANLEQSMAGYGLNKYAALLREWSNMLGRISVSLDAAGAGNFAQVSAGNNESDAAAGNFAKQYTVTLKNTPSDVWALRESWTYFVQAVAPIMPHLAEEMGSFLGFQPGIHLRMWPDVDQNLLQEDRVTMGVQINGKHRGVVQLSSAATEQEIIQAVRENVALQKHLGGVWTRTIVIPGRMISIVVPPEPYPQKI